MLLLISVSILGLIIVASVGISLLNSGFFSKQRESINEIEEIKDTEERHMAISPYRMAEIFEDCESPAAPIVVQKQTERLGLESANELRSRAARQEKENIAQQEKIKKELWIRFAQPEIEKALKELKNEATIHSYPYGETPTMTQLKVLKNVALDLGFHTRILDTFLYVNWKEECPPRYKTKSGMIDLKSLNKDSLRV